MKKIQRNKYLINICKSVRNSSSFTSTFRSIFLTKTAYIFKIVDKLEQLDVCGIW